MNYRQLRLPIGPLSDTPYVVVDTETTGLDPQVDRVVEIAALRFEAGRVTDRFESLVDPQRDIPPDSSEHHHLTDRDVEGAPPLEALDEPLSDFVGDDPVVAHNAAFDRSFIAALNGRRWVCSTRRTPPLAQGEGPPQPIPQILARARPGRHQGRFGAPRRRRRARYRSRLPPPTPGV